MDDKRKLLKGVKSYMDIQILSCIEGAKQAKGLTVIIDVFRAFSLECYLFAAGAKEIFPIGELQSAFQLKKEHPDWLLFGERKGAKVAGCDFGNSPSEVKGMDFTGKTLIHTTSAGTQGITNAIHADAILTAGLVNAKATAAYIEKTAPAYVSIVGMGNAGIQPTKEDQLCAEYIKLLLEHKDMDIQKYANNLEFDGAQHFFDPSNAVFPLSDFYLSTNCNLFDFVIEVRKENSYWICRKKAI